MHDSRSVALQAVDILNLSIDALTPFIEHRLESSTNLLYSLLNLLDGEVFVDMYPTSHVGVEDVQCYSPAATRSRQKPTVNVPNWRKVGS